jgi:hypothetical protein
MAAFMWTHLGYLYYTPDLTSYGSTVQCAQNKLFEIWTCTQAPVPGSRERDLKNFARERWSRIYRVNRSRYKSHHEVAILGTKFSIFSTGPLKKITFAAHSPKFTFPDMQLFPHIHVPPGPTQCDLVTRAHVRPARKSLLPMTVCF